MVDPRSRLQYLADHGCSAFPPSDFEQFWWECVHWVEDTGDRAVLVLGRCCLMLAAFWDGSVATADVDEIDQLLKSLLPDVLAQLDVDTAVAQGLHLREQLKLLLFQLRP